MTPLQLESVAMSCRVCERLDKGRMQEKEEDEAFAARVAQRLREAELAPLMSEKTFTELYTKAAEASGRYLVNVNDVMNFYRDFVSTRSGKSRFVPSIPNPFRGIPLDTELRVRVAKRVWAALIFCEERNGTFDGRNPDGSLSMRDWVSILNDDPTDGETQEFWRIFHTPNSIPPTLASRLDEAGIPFPAPFREYP